MSLLKVMIIDSEANSSAIIKNYLSDFDFEIQIINNVPSPDWLISELKTNKPDIIFFDVQFYIFHILDSIDYILLKNMQLLFVSSDEKLAWKAIQYNATDFILKPLKIESIALAINKATKNIQNQRYIEKKLKIDNQNIKIDSDIEYLAIASLDKIDIIKKKNIEYCVAEGRYTTFLIDDGKKFTACKNLGDYEDTLGLVDFFRVHNSYIVNVNHISKIIKKDGYSIELLSGNIIPVAKRRIEDFNKFLKLK